ncbi:MAG: hypothetical protein A2Z45_08245 [Chloroflexi bacterium RBG_19FT_COMBO_55_16]|nr:MAG: hypothetical protein A2Z45_08245 [Chloroflexi bacterium RBG_19FT_COMBO_55_16]
MRYPKFLVITSVLFALVLLLTTIVSTKANPGQVIDFEGFSEGDFVYSVYSGHGVSGDAVNGDIAVRGYNPRFGLAVNAAMIFDATCQPGGTPADCSGGGYDLFNPAEGNVLIVSADLDQSDPDDDARPGAYVWFDFTNWGPGSVTVESVDVQDVDVEEPGDAYIQLFAGGSLISEILIPDTGDGWTTVTIGVSGVDGMLVNTNASGSILNVRLSTEPTAVQLSYFRLDSLRGEKVSLVWETGAEVDNYGFYLFRAAENNITLASSIHFEPAAGGSGGHTYTYEDTVPRSGVWWYWLSDVDTKGIATYHGPERTYQTFLPVTLAPNR